MTMRRLMQIVESAYTDDRPIRAHIAPHARRAFGYKGHDKPIAADDPRVVRNPIPMPVGDEARKRLIVAKQCKTAAQYATRLNPIHVERGDRPHILAQHDAEHERLEREWIRWKANGLLD